MMAGTELKQAKGFPISDANEDIAGSADIDTNKQAAGERSKQPPTPTELINHPAKLSDQLDALAKLQPSVLRQQWTRLYKTQPPPRMSPDLLLLAVSWKVQARALGGLGAQAKRKLAELARKSGGLERGSAMNTIRLKPGTKLIREWHGDIHEILVLEEGFEWCGNHYRSLTQIASLITGAHWSGPRFFGLKAKQDNFAKSIVDDADAQEKLSTKCIKGKAGRDSTMGNADRKDMD